MTVLRPSACDDCGRIWYERGGHFVIEAARMRDGQVPGDAFLGKLCMDERYDDLADTLVRFEMLARYGSLDVPRQINSLGDDLWEIKAGSVRLPFYYALHSNVPAIRITSGFFKTQRFTQIRHIRWARRVRMEDQAI